MRIYKYKCDFCGREFECSRKNPEIQPNNIAVPCGIAKGLDDPNTYNLWETSHELCDGCLKNYLEIFANFLASVDELRERKSKVEEVFNV